MKLVLILSILSFSLFAQEAKVDENINFDSIRDVLAKDRLDETAKAKKEEQEKARIKAERSKKARFDLPTENDFWKIMSELWLVKNQQILKWDFQKPDFGLDSSFKEFLEKRGIYEKKFYILLSNSPNVTHFALPTKEGEYLFVLSLPFIRTLDLSKLEIALLLLEDMARADADLFKAHVRPTAQELIGKNYYGGKLDIDKVNAVLKKYDEMILDKGFTFSQQFQITKYMDQTLKSDPELWGTYYRMIGKFDKLLKENTFYSNYAKIYPSPELQLNWLAPTGKKQ